MTIPNGLPTLASGGHTPYGGKACIMEYVSLLAGEPWTDQPECVFPTIGSVARVINDQCSATMRQRLLVLVPRLLTANRPRLNHQEVNDHLCSATRKWCNRQSDMYGLLALHGASNDAALFNEVVGWEAKHERAIEFLTFLLDEFDAYVGPAIPATVTDEQYEHATTQIGRGYSIVFEPAPANIVKVLPPVPVAIP